MSEDQDHHFMIVCTQESIDSELLEDPDMPTGDCEHSSYHAVGYWPSEQIGDTLLTQRKDPKRASLATTDEERHRDGWMPRWGE